MKTLFIDIDGTIVKNLSDNELQITILDKNFTQDLLPGVDHFFKCLNETDKVIFVTARSECYRDMTIRMLNNNKIKYSQLIMDLSMG